MYTVVDNLYNVVPYFTLHDLCLAHADTGLIILPADGREPQPATIGEIRKAFRTSRVVELSTSICCAWKYRMVRHN